MSALKYFQVTRYTSTTTRRYQRPAEALVLYHPMFVCPAKVISIKPAHVEGIALLLNRFCFKRLMSDNSYIRKNTYLRIPIITAIYGEILYT